MNARRARWLRRADRCGRWLENAVLFFLLGGLILLSAGQIALRNIFSTGLPWADPAVRMMVLWLALAGGIAAGRDRKQIAIDVVTRLLPRRARRAADAAACLFTCAVTAAVAWHSLRFVRDSHAFGDTVFGWPAWIFQLILPVGFAAIAYRYFLRALMPGAGAGTGAGAGARPETGPGPGPEPDR